MTEDLLVRQLSGDGTIGIATLVGTGLVTEARRRHETSPTATVALGRTLLGALLLAAGKKDGETAQVQLRGDGALGAVTAIATAEGAVRGFVSRHRVDVRTPSGAIDVARAIGLGTLRVIRHHPSWREAYTGIVPLTSGEIAEDLALYLVESEQVPSAVGLGVTVAEDGSVVAAAGFLVQALPGAADDALARVEANAAALGGPSGAVADGMDAETMAARLLDGLGRRAPSARGAAFACPCSRERALRGASLLGSTELRDMARRNEPVEVRCEFCAEFYHLNPAEVVPAAVLN